MIVNNNPDYKMYKKSHEKNNKSPNFTDYFFYKPKTLEGVHYWHTLHTRKETIIQKLIFWT